MKANIKSVIRKSLWHMHNFYTSGFYLGSTKCNVFHKLTQANGVPLFAIKVMILSQDDYSVSQQRCNQITDIDHRRFPFHVAFQLYSYKYLTTVYTLKKQYITLKFHFSEHSSGYEFSRHGTQAFPGISISIQNMDCGLAIAVNLLFSVPLTKFRRS